MDTQGPTVDELIRAAAERGYQVTRWQVERWHKAGLLPRREQIHSPGVRGSIGHYPPGVEGQFLALCRLRDRRRKLSELRFWLWWEGFEVSSVALRKTLKQYLRPSGQWIRLHSKHLDPFDAAEAAAARSVGAARRDPVLRMLNRNLHKNREDLLTALTTVNEFSFGGKPLWDGDGLEVDGDDPQDEVQELPPSEILFRALGLERAAQERIGDLGPWFVGNSALVPQVFELLRSGGFRNLASLMNLVEVCTDDELRRARMNAQFLAEDLPAVLAVIRARLGPGAGGLELLAPPGPLSIYPRVSALAYGIALQRAGFGNLIASFAEEMRDGIVNARLFVRFARTFPQHTRFLKPLAEGKVDEIPEEVMDALRQVVASQSQD